MKPTPKYEVAYTGRVFLHRRVGSTERPQFNWRPSSLGYIRELEEPVVDYGKIEAIVRSALKEQGAPSPQAAPAGYIRKSEAASYLGIKSRTLNGWMKDHHVPYIKVGRTPMFNKADLDAALKALKIAEVRRY